MTPRDLLRRSHPSVDSPTYRALRDGRRLDPERMQRAVYAHVTGEASHRCAPQCGADLAGIYDALPPRCLPNVHPNWEEAG